MEEDRSVRTRLPRSTKVRARLKVPDGPSDSVAGSYARQHGKPGETEGINLTHAHMRGATRPPTGGQEDVLRSLEIKAGEP